MHSCGHSTAAVFDFSARSSKSAKSSIEHRARARCRRSRSVFKQCPRGQRPSGLHRVAACVAVSSGAMPCVKCAPALCRRRRRPPARPPSPLLPFCCRRASSTKFDGRWRTEERSEGRDADHQGQGPRRVRGALGYLITSQQGRGRRPARRPHARFLHPPGSIHILAADTPCRSCSRSRQPPKYAVPAPCTE